MFYFVPSWYHQDRPWYHQIQLWFRILERMTFDDTVNQVKMFQQAQEEVCLLVLNYQPQFRYYLHKQGLLQTPYWSFFDDIQNISAVTAKPLSFKDLNWPDGVEFLYSPFAVAVRLDGQDYATIHFAQDGNLFYIDFFDQGRTIKHYLFDDRGFLSSILYFNQEGLPLYQDYLNESGVWQVREHLEEQETGQIEINPYADHLFHKRFYENWEELLRERLLILNQEALQPNDRLVIASHSQHNDLLLDVFTQQQKIFSFFGERFDYDQIVSTQRMLAEASLLVVDTKKQEEQLRSLMKSIGQMEKELLRISPYDTRLRLGHSQVLKEQEIYFFLDSITEEEVKETLSQILQFMNQHEDVTLSLVTFDQNRNLDELKAWVTGEIHQSFPSESFFQIADTGNENQLEEDEEQELSRISFHLLTNENGIIAALDSARLVLDLGEEPDMYTQIASISAGVPQINRVKTEFVSHKENGWLLSSQSDLEKALTFYLVGLANWNRSLVYTVQKMADYTGGQILEQWQQLLDKE